MHYRLSFVQPLQETVPAIAVHQLDSAIERLQSADRDQKAIHAARRHFKRTRALLDLVEPSARGKIAATGQKRLASAARMLAASRDAQAAVSAAGELEKSFGDGRNGRAFSDLASFVKARLDRAEEKLQQTSVQTVLEKLKKTKAALSKLDLSGMTMTGLLDSASQTYRRGRHAMKDALESECPEDLHRWRKLVQQHWRHMLLLKDSWPKEAGARIALARRLSGELGLHHDLAILRETISENRIVFRRPSDVKLLIRCISKKQEELAGKAASRGERLFAEKPKAFSRRLGVYWQSTERVHAPAEPAQPED
jgi:CHAD domain-containing protein